MGKSPTGKIDTNAIKQHYLCIIEWTCSVTFTFVYQFFSLYPGDLYAFTRRPTFLIVDSDNSSSFGSFSPNTSFEQPLVVLMSPQDVPSTFRGETATANTAGTLGISSASREQPSNEKLINIGYGNYKLMQPWHNQVYRSLLIISLLFTPAFKNAKWYFKACTDFSAIRNVHNRIFCSCKSVVANYPKLNKYKNLF